MTFVVRELVRGVWLARGESPSYKEAEAIAKAIKEARLARGEQPKSIDKTLQVTNELKLLNSLSEPIVQRKEKRGTSGSLSGGKAPLVYLGALLLLFLSTKIVAIYAPQPARLLFGIGLVAWFLAPIVAAFRGMKFREVLGVVQTFACIMVALFLIALVLPSSCSNYASHDNLEWARKP